MPAIPTAPSAELIADDVSRALAEDLGPGDATAALLADGPAQAYVVAKEPGVIAGAPWFDACFRRLDPAVRRACRDAVVRSDAGGSGALPPDPFAPGGGADIVDRRGRQLGDGRDVVEQSDETGGHGLPLAVIARSASDEAPLAMTSRVR